MARRVEFKNNSNNKLVGVHYKGQSKNLIVMCHGYKSSKDNPALESISKSLHKSGYSVLRFDFTGHGDSEGDPGIDIIQQVSDIESVIDYYQKKYDGFILVGASFAGFISAIAAIRSESVVRLISINGLFYPSMAGMKYFQFLFSCLFNEQNRSQLSFYKKYFSPELIKIPTLVIHVKNDSEVNSKQSKKFCSMLMTEQKLVILEEGDHSLTNEKYVSNVFHEINSWLGIKDLQ
jgi:hypothetical protein